MNIRQFFFEGTLQLHAGDTELFDLMHLISFVVPFKEIIRRCNLQYCTNRFHVNLASMLMFYLLL